MKFLLGIDLSKLKSINLFNINYIDNGTRIDNRKVIFDNKKSVILKRTSKSTKKRKEYFKEI